MKKLIAERDIKVFNINAMSIAHVLYIIKYRIVD